VLIGIQGEHGERKQSWLFPHLMASVLFSMILGTGPSVPQTRHAKGLIQGGLNAVTHRDSRFIAGLKKIIEQQHRILSLPPRLPETWFRLNTLHAGIVGMAMKGLGSNLIHPRGK
jgi:hypothetical protein